MALASSLLDTVLAGRRDRVTHVEVIPERGVTTAPWPAWVDPVVRERLAGAGMPELWSHQAEAANLAWRGRSVVVATGTASGKSLAYLLPGMTAARASGTTLYLAPTKALAADQARALGALEVPGVFAAIFDGDTPIQARDAARDHADYLLTNPDMLHRSILPRHHKWARFLRALRFVVIDECHMYRGVFGSHVAQVLRRLRRVCALHGSAPVLILASATTSDPDRSAQRLTGVDVTGVVTDGSPAGQKRFALWDPPVESTNGEHGAPVRRSTLAEAADVTADLVAADARTVTFVRSRRAAETVAALTRHRLDSAAPDLRDRVAAYRGGYLPEERRDLERALHSGQLRALAATTALELGVDVSGLDSVVIAGWPGTRASLWQQAGRAGRRGADALAVLIARDDPLDQYFVHHPEAIFGTPTEATVLDPDNPYVLGPHLCAAAQESPLTDHDITLFGPAAPDVVASLDRQRLLRRRASGWHWVGRGWAADLADLRGSAGAVVHLVEEKTGRLLGTVDPGRAHATVHAGAVYVHQSETYIVERLDLEESVAFVRPDAVDYTTVARDVTEMRIVEVDQRESLGAGTLHLGTVDVSNQVVGYLKRRIGSGEVIGDEALDLPPRELRTKAVWWTLPDKHIPVPAADTPGAAHAAEHAAIGLLPLVATCDRWDIGGLSSAAHADTGELTVFVYDGHAGGAGFAERGYAKASEWLTATRDAIAGCACPDGCPSCVQSPKCGNGNEPLHKAGAVALLDQLIRPTP